MGDFLHRTQADCLRGRTATPQRSRPGRAERALASTHAFKRASAGLDGENGVVSSAAP